MTKLKCKPKWYFFFALVVLGVAVIALLPGYTFTGLTLLGFAGLIAIYSGIQALRRHYPAAGRIAFGAMTAFLCIFFALAAFTCTIIAGAARGSEDPEADYLIVLGAGVNGETPSLSLRERINAAYDYLAAYPDAVCIVSGGQGGGEDISEAECMFRELTAAGIDPDRIWLEDQATSTLENLAFSLDLIESRTGSRPESAAIVSSEYHLYRASMFASWLSLEAKLVPAQTGMVTLRWNYYLREIFAVWYYFIFGG